VGPSPVRVLGGQLAPPPAGCALFALALPRHRRRAAPPRRPAGVIGRRSLPTRWCHDRGHGTTTAGGGAHLRSPDYGRWAIGAGCLLPDVDLLIRTGGERRLSDFLLWESAYAELVFLDRLWPDFTGADLAAALRDFHGRERRFGGLPAAAADDPVPRAAVAVLGAGVALGVLADLLLRATWGANLVVWIAAVQVWAPRSPGAGVSRSRRDALAGARHPAARR
jgi:hypothetical protein